MQKYQLGVQAREDGGYGEDRKKGTLFEGYFGGWVDKILW